MLSEVGSSLWSFPNRIYVSKVPWRWAAPYCKCSRGIVKHIHGREVNPFPEYKTCTDYDCQTALPGIDARRNPWPAIQKPKVYFSFEAWPNLLSLVYPDIELTHQGNSSSWIFDMTKAPSDTQSLLVYVSVNQSIMLLMSPSPCVSIF